MWQVYIYLDKVGTIVADPDTDRDALKLADRTILDELMRRAGELYAEWKNFRAAVDDVDESESVLPETLFEAMYKDVTAKTKTIALAAALGPDYRSMMTWMADRMREGLRKEGRSAAEIEAGARDVRRTMHRIIAAKDPDELSGETTT